MRPLIIGGLVTLLAACTLLVPIDDDLTSGVGAKPNEPSADAGKDTSTVTNPSDAGAEAAPPFDSGEPFGPAREGCPNGVSLDPDLAGYYPFDETTGNTLHDCSQGAHDLAALSAAVPTWSDGHIGGAGDFDGVDGCFGATDSTLNKFEFSPFSISVWIQPRVFFEDDTDKSGRWIVSHKVSPKGWHLGTDDPNRVELDLEWNIPGGSKTQISATSESGTWIHFVATYDNTKHEAFVYKNGVLADKQSGEDKVPGNFGTGDNVLFRIGCRNTKSGVFNGKIDELRIYPKVISEAQIAKLSEAR